MFNGYSELENKVFLKVSVVLDSLKSADSAFQRWVLHN